jgi:HTH-type transcriptional regulator / antitoxin HipB
MRITTTEDFGRYLRERRRALGPTQTQLAAKARVSRRWLSDLEAGKERAELGLVIQTVHALSMIVDLQPEENTGQINLDDFLNQRRARPRMPIAADAQNSDPDRGGDHEPKKDQR